MISKRPNGRYQVRIYWKSRHVKSKTFEKKSKAQEWEHQQYLALAGTSWVDPTGGETTLSEWMAAWWPARRQVKDSTHARYTGIRDAGGVVGQRRDLTFARATRHRGRAGAVSELDRRRQAHGSAVLARHLEDRALVAAL